MRELGVILCDFALLLWVGCRRVWGSQSIPLAQNSRNMKISHKTLQDLGACAEQLKLFRSRFGEQEIEVTRALVLAQAQDWEWNWAAGQLLSSAAQAEYYKARAAAWEEWSKADAAVWAEYDKAVAPAEAECDKADAAVEAEYYKTLAVAFADAAKLS